MVDDRGVDDDPRLELLLHRPPLALETGAAQRQNYVTFLRFRLQHVHEDDVPDAELRRRLGMSTVELAVRNHTFALRADVDENLVSVDTNDGAFNDVAVLEALDVGVLLGQQLLHGGGLGPQDNRLLRGLFRLLGGGRVCYLGFAHRCRFGGGRGGRLAGLDHLHVVLVTVVGLDRCCGSGRGGLVGLVGLVGLDRRGGCSRGGLVGEGLAGGLLGRPISDRGCCLGLRRGPAHLLFGQDLSPMVDSRPGKQNGSSRAQAVSRTAVRGLRALGPLLRSGYGSALYLSCPRAA